MKSMFPLSSVALGAAGLGLWIYPAAWLTPAVARIHQGDDDPGELHIWVQEQRELEIVLVAVALVTALLRCGPVALPAMVASVGLFAADAIVDNADFVGWPAAGTLLAVAALVLAAAAWWSLAWGRSMGRDPLATRRAAAATAVVAALVTPALVIDFEDVGAFTGLPAGLVPVGAAVMIAMWYAAVTLASAARRARLSRVAFAAWFAIPVVVLVGVEVIPGSLESAPAFGAGTVLAVVVLGIGRNWSSWRARRWVLWIVGGVLAFPVYFIGSFLCAEAFGPMVMKAAGYEYPSDGIPYLPGALPLAIVLGLALALLVAPYPAGQPAWLRGPEPDRTPEPMSPAAGT